MKCSVDGAHNILRLLLLGCEIWNSFLVILTIRGFYVAIFHYEKSVEGYKIYMFDID